MQKRCVIAVSLLAAGVLTHETPAQTNVVALDENTLRVLRDATEERWFNKENFVSLLLGGALTLAGTWFAYWLQAKHERDEDAEFVEGVLRAIRSEIESLGQL